MLTSSVNTFRGLKKKKSKILEELRSGNLENSTEDEIDEFLRSIKAVPSDSEVDDFLRSIKAVPDESEIDDFLKSIKAQDEKGRPMLYKDGQPVIFAPSGSSPFASESIGKLKEKGTIKERKHSAGGIESTKEKGTVKDRKKSADSIGRKILS